MAAPLRIPDLLFEIASNLSDLADISRLSRCDRMSHELTMPLLFRNICIPIQKATSVAYVLRKYPHYSRGCRSFTLDGSCEGATTKRVSDSFDVLFEHLAVVLLTLADNARVKSLWWCKKERPKFFIPAAVPTYVWEALAKLSGSLEELHIVISEIDENWDAICAPEYSQLRTLDVLFEDNLSWDDCSPLQVMLTGLCQLEDLYIHLPVCGSSFGIDLSSYHPRLRRFSFSADALDGQALSFLNRHPTIECLCIGTVGGYTLNDRDLPQLKALRVDWSAMSETPGLLSPGAGRPITHLRVDDLHSMAIPAMHQLVGNAHATLRYLELIWSITGFRQHIAECMTLLRLVHQLEELRITGYSDVFPSGPPLCEEDLVHLLSLSDSTNIARLRLADTRGEPLSEHFLSNVGTVPASLEYISWEVQRKLVTYRLESREGKIVAVLADFPYSEKTILDFDDWLG